MKENNLLLEINNYRRLMGIPLISVKKHINEDNENVANTVDDVTEEEITKLINKTGKTLEEIINSPILTETELGILFKIAKLKNLEPYNEIMSSFYQSEEYKKLITDTYLTLINEYGDKLKLDVELPTFKYAGII